MRVLELFSGYGSQALALENLGIEFTSDISEIDKYAIQAYNQLHGETHNWGDITKIDETKLPYYDLITYSFPCQDVSLAGLQRGLDKGTETRSSLLWECERIIRSVKPKYLLMENVKNLVGEKHKHNFIRWLHILEMMGYQNYYKVLNAKDYGVPQNRERVFVVSILGCQQYLFPNPIKLTKRLKDVLESKVDEKYYLSESQVNGFIKETLRAGEKDNNFAFNPKDFGEIGNSISPKSGWRKTDNFIQEPVAYDEQNKNVRQDGCVGTLTTDGSTPKHNNRVVEPLFIRENTQKGYTQAFVGDSITLDQPTSETRRGRVGHQVSQTLTTSCNVGVIKNNYRIRKLTPRECWRLMGVKDEQFDKLHDLSNTQLYKMAGNSIVVDVLMGIFKNLLQSDEETTGQLRLL